MEKFIIEGGRRLRGSVKIGGAKNAVVAIIPATILSNGVSKLENVPDIEDVRILFEIIGKLGAVITKHDKHTYTVDTRNIHSTRVEECDTAKLRASYYLMGSLLGRFRQFEVAMPGGDDIGSRPIDLHVKSFRALDAVVDDSGKYVTAKAENGLKAGSIFFNRASVGATINAILAAVCAEGVTVINNPAKEPHIIDLVNYLNKCGANIRGAGTNEIKIRGVKGLHGCEHSLIPDQIEAGTYMLACAAAGGDITVKNVIPKHLELITQKLLECGVFVDEFNDSVDVHAKGRPHKCDIITAPYPGFPTDMQAQFGVLLSLAEGTGTIKETIWDNRFKYADQLRKMGADITISDDKRTAVFSGVEKLRGAPVIADDIRAGAAMIIAGLAAEGKTEIGNIIHIDRGYEDIVDKLRALGANICRVDFPDGNDVVKAKKLA